MGENEKPQFLLPALGRQHLSAVASLLGAGTQSKLCYDPRARQTPHTAEGNPVQVLPAPFSVEKNLMTVATGGIMKAPRTNRPAKLLARADHTSLVSAGRVWAYHRRRQRALAPPAMPGFPFSWRTFFPLAAGYKALTAVPV